MQPHILLHKNCWINLQCMRYGKFIVVKSIGRRSPHQLCGTLCHLRFSRHLRWLCFVNDWRRIYFRNHSLVSYSDDYVSVDLTITFVILDTLNIFLIDWLIERIIKIGQYLPKLRSYKKGTVFDSQCIRFLPRDAMHKRGICLHAVSVCLSRSCMSSVKTNKHIFEFFSPWDSQAILVFPYQTGWRYSDGNPLTGASDARGVLKNDDFRPISRSVSETVIVRWAHAVRQFVSIEFSFHPYNI